MVDQSTAREFTVFEFLVFFCLFDRMCIKLNFKHACLETKTINVNLEDAIFALEQRCKICAMFLCLENGAPKSQFQ